MLRLLSDGTPQQPFLFASPKPLRGHSAAQLADVKASSWAQFGPGGRRPRGRGIVTAPVDADPRRARPAALADTFEARLPILDSDPGVAKHDNVTASAPRDDGEAGATDEEAAASGASPRARRKPVNQRRTNPPHMGALPVPITAKMILKALHGTPLEFSLDEDEDVEIHDRAEGGELVFYALPRNGDVRFSASFSLPAGTEELAAIRTANLINRHLGIVRAAVHLDDGVPRAMVVDWFLAAEVSVTSGGVAAAAVRFAAALRAVTLHVKEATTKE